MDTNALYVDLQNLTRIHRLSAITSTYVQSVDPLSFRKSMIFSGHSVRLPPLFLPPLPSRARPRPTRHRVMTPAVFPCPIAHSGAGSDRAKKNVCQIAPSFSPDYLSIQVTCFVIFVFALGFVWVESNDRSYVLFYNRRSRDKIGDRAYVLFYN